MKKLSNQNININQSKASLQTHQLQNPKKCVKILNPEQMWNRTLSFFSSRTEASMCVEASLSFSLFFIFFVNIISIIFMFSTYVKEMEILQQQTKKIASISYTKESKWGINDEIRRSESISYRSFIPILSYQRGTIETVCVVKPWTGYDEQFQIGKEEEDTYVYVTEYGEVFHKSRSCSHLSLSLKMIQMKEMIKQTKSYTPCILCVGSRIPGSLEMVYFTNWGDKYHYSLSCKGIKRTIYSKLRSEVTSMAECLTCGG